MSEPITHIDGKPEGEGELQAYIVTYDFCYTYSGTRKIIIKASCEKDAEKIASLAFGKESWDEYKIISVEREAV